MDHRNAVRTARCYLDELVARARVPGIQYVVVSPEETVLEHASGWADIAGERVLGPSTTMMAYSMSKPITAAAVLQLVEARTLRLDSSISSYLQWQPYGPDVTVGQLLSHTSGVPNPIPLRWVHPARSHDAFDERAALAEVLRGHPRLSFAPGTRYAYSNIGYWLLGYVVERACGEPFPTFVRDHVLRRLGMASRELGYVVPDYQDHAKGYLERYSLLNLVKRVVIAKDLVGGYEKRWLHIEDHHVNGAAFGGMVGNAGGFGKFLQDQLRSRSALFGDETHRSFYTPQRTTDGALIPMTLGWNIGTADETRFFYKEGGGGGFHAMMRLYPSSRIGTVVMTNATCFDVRRVLDTLDPGFLRTMRESRQHVDD